MTDCVICYAGERETERDRDAEDWIFTFQKFYLAILLSGRKQQRISIYLEWIACVKAKVNIGIVSI